MSQRSNRDPLTANALVVRGGVLEVEGVKRRVEKDSPRLLRKTGIRYGLSVAADALPLAELIEVGRIPHDELQKTTVERLLEAGFTIEPTFAYPHCTINLGIELSDEVVGNLIAVFDPPEERPSADGT